ncbi:MAG: SusF/SusE family outer membrane protein [Bacteroidaceae bacterium]|nr:SusF/SusE family outer membrane protein [Bacteroidaceae bacterium]
MKKFFTLLCVALVSAVGFAQDAYDPSQHTAFVSGTSNICSGQWSSEDAMAYDSESGLWKVTLPVKDTNMAMFKVVYDGGWYPDANVEVQVSEPSDVEITFDPKDNTVAFSGEKVIDVVKKIEFIVATGSEGLFGVSWDVSGDHNKMEKLDNAGQGYYQLTLTDIAAGTYDFKFCANGTWDSGLEWGGLSDPTVVGNAEVVPATDKGGKNFRMTLDKGYTYTVVLTLDLMSETPSVSAEWTATGGAEITDDIYSLAGTFNGWNQTDESTEMTKVSDGVYSITVPMPAGENKFKVVKDHDWAVAYPAEDYVLNLEQDADVTITIDLNNDGAITIATAECSVYFVTVNVQSDKEAVNLYAAETDSWNQLTGNWPGAAMNKIEGGFTYTVKLTKGEKLWIIFNGEGGQTSNIEVNGVSHSCTLEYILNSDWTYQTGTGVQGIEAQKLNGAIYTVAGQRVSKPVRGLYIQNGKKVVIK